LRQARQRRAVIGPFWLSESPCFGRCKGVGFGRVHEYFRVERPRRGGEIAGHPLKDPAAEEIEDAVYDLKAVNLNKKPVVDTRTPEELMDIIETKGKEIGEALSILRKSR